MTADEYINNNTQSHWLLIKGVGGYEDCVLTEIAFKAIEMARKEERDKAMYSFKKILNQCTDCKDSCSAKCGKECLENKFKEFLNK